MKKFNVGWEHRRRVCRDVINVNTLNTQQTAHRVSPYMCIYRNCFIVSNLYTQIYNANIYFLNSLVYCEMHPSNTIVSVLRDESLQYSSLVYCEMHPSNTIV